MTDSTISQDARGIPCHDKRDNYCPVCGWDCEDGLRTPAGEAGEMVERFWLSLREPGCVPERKGPWPLRETAKILREFIAARPTAYIDYITLDCFGAPHIQHGPEVLQMADGRSMGAGRKHNARVRDAVPNFWQRFNDWTSDRTPGKPFEICRYGRDDEDEIVVVHACASQGEADEKQLDAILEARAQATLSATPTEAMQQRVERLEVALRGLLSSYIGTCRFYGRVISEIEQHHCVIDARAALGDDVG